MWWLVLTVVLWNTISSQPVTDEAQGARASRLVDFVECCPCPGSSHGLATAARPDSLPRAVDDCPCLRRGDAEESPSDFLPRAVRPDRPFMRPQSSKEEIKPLLKPEVGLASSMLETLREVTDEEYQEALARDAARNAARVADLAGAQPDTANNVLTIIVNPIEDEEKRDAIHEASQPVETICIPPAANLEQVREVEKTPRFKLATSLGKKTLDMDSGASNRQESTAGLNTGLERLKLRTTPSLLKLYSPKKTAEKNIQSLLKLKDNMPPKNIKEKNKLDDRVQLKLPLLRFPPLFKQNEDLNPIRSIELGIKKLKIPKTRTNISLQRKVTKNDDNSPSPSIIQQQIVLPLERSNTPTNNLNTKPLNDAPETALNLENLLQLRDLNLISPNLPKISLPKLNLFPSLRTNNPSRNSFNKHQKSERLTKNCKIGIKETKEQSNEMNTGVHTSIIEAVPKSSVSDSVAKNKKVTKLQDDQNVETEILDALPGASENNEVFIDNLSSVSDSVAINRKETNLQDDQHVETGILDALPGASESNEVFLDSLNNFDDVEPHQVEESGIESETNLSKNNVDNVDSNSKSEEIVIEDDENIPFEQIEIIQGAETPFNKIEISDIASGAEGEELELEINPFDNIDNTENTGPMMIEGENEETNDFEFGTVQDSQEVDIGLEERSDEANAFFGQFSSGQDATPEASVINIETKSAEFVNESNNEEGIKEDILETNDTSAPSNLDQTGSITDFLSSLKERISSKLNTMKKPYRNHSKFSQKNEPEVDIMTPFDKSSLSSDESTNIESLTEDTEKILIKEKAADIIDTSQVNMQDLKQLSDSILKQSEAEKTSKSNSTQLLKEKNKSADTTHESLQLDKTSFLKENDNDTNEQEIVDMDSSATTQVEDFEDNNENATDFEENSKDLNDSNAKNVKNALFSSDNSCASNLLPVQSAVNRNTKKSVSNLSNNDESEMTPAASESVLQTSPHFESARNPSSPLLHQSIIVQPSSLFSPIAPLDLSSVPSLPTLPTLDEIRTGITDLLNGNSRTAEDNKEIDSDDDCFDDEPTMSSDASTTNTNSIFPPFRPLEDINLDIFQLNPLSKSSPLLSKFPSLNLNSFKTKLAVPKSALLKPMKLQSALGSKNGGLLGATLTFGHNNIVSGSETKPIIDLDSIINRQGIDLLGSPLSKIPSIEELRSTIRANTKSILKSPLVSPLTDTLKTTESFGDNLRSHTENTMKNIQQTLSSTLSEARVNTPGLKLTKPHDLLEMISSAHEDMKDKLYGIHVDLQDRLESIHDSILDKTKFRIPTLQSPLFNTLGRLQDNSPSRTLASNNLKKTPSPKLIINKKKPRGRENKPISSTKELNKAKPFKLSKAASFLTPKTVEVPKLMVSSSKPPFLGPLQRDFSLKLTEPSPMFSNDQREITSKTKLKPFGIKTKVTIATTPRPIKKNTVTPKFDRESVKSRKEPTLASRLSKQTKKQFESFRDSSGFASEPQISKVLPNGKQISTSQSEKVSAGENQSLKSSVLASPASLTKFSLHNPLKARSNLLNKEPKQQNMLSTSSPKLSSSLVALPKATESPLVSKMREAIRIRFSRPSQSIEKQQPRTLGKSHGKDDMKLSATENKGVVIKTEPMKENVSYKCKMVCVRDG